jgi:hypothetical protein
LQQGCDVSEAVTIDEGVSMPMQASPLAVRPSEDLGHAEIPATLDAHFVVGELDRCSLDEDEPGQIAVGSASEEFDRAGSPSPLGSDGPLALGRLSTSWTEAADGAEDGAVGRKGVWSAVAVDPRLVVGTTALEKLGEFIITRHRSHHCRVIAPRERTSRSHLEQQATPYVPGASPLLARRRSTRTKCTDEATNPMAQMATSNTVVATGRQGTGL